MELGKSQEMSIIGKNKRVFSPDLLITLFFAAYFILGILLADDYGIHWDDHAQYNHGLVSAQYINESCHGCLSENSFSDTALESYKDRSHGVIFQLTALGIQHLLGIHEIRGIFLLRHYLTFIIFFIGLIFFYRLLNDHFKNKYIALSGVIMLILSPRIFADSFYNSKDIVFLSLTIISSWTLYRFYCLPSYKSASYHALTSALLISTRITGIFMPALTIFFILLKPFMMKENGLTGKFSQNIKRNFGLNGLVVRSSYYILLTFAMTVTFWPYLWAHPLQHFSEIFTTMSHFKWDDPVLFRGEFLKPDLLPFYYIPWWLAITTPVIYTFLFIAGLGFILFTKKWNEARLFDVLAVSLLFVPLLIVILLGSVVYDGWRQMFFLFVPFLIIAVKGFYEIKEWIYRRYREKSALSLIKIIWICLALSWISTATFMVRNHPFENVYFNFLAGKEPVKNYEGDYWGLSYRQVLEYILENDPSDTIKVITVNWPGQANADILPLEQRKRLKYTSLREAGYLISNYRFPKEHNKFFNRENPYDKPLYEIEVGKNCISGVYLLKR